ncbi:FAD linked oxidase protein [Oesophagostomum dentatum]|uniref:D-2-hydroxyglutarate dehydrogenase, mitochondrial n=1 Tax=Oesophagostomum dentatum TaxID=61180 RepID=A0A0B1T0S6_OESDE|nr:FAD linked oxidase protein [Oesophagostomum dentatum]
MLLKLLRHYARGVATVARDPRFATVQDADLRLFESICGREHVKTTEIDNYSTDWMKVFKGKPVCVLLPGSTEEVSALLAHCSKRRIAVVPQVLPTEEGTVLKLGSALKKDNTSLHTPHLFLGSEGQLGVITHVTMAAVPKPTSVQSAMLGVETFDGCCEVLRLARRHLSEILSSFEFLDREIMTALEENLDLKPVLQSSPRFTLLVETSGSDETHDTAKMERFLAHCIDEGLASDGVQAQSATESAAMWRLRESAPLAVAADGFAFKNDVSLPLKHFYELTEAVRSRCSSLTKRIVTYGHLGDGNSHLNVTAKKFSKELYDKLYPFIYEWVNDHNGSISAEHGIGQVKLPYAAFGKSQAERDIVRRIKSVFDPNGILNPYKTF